MLKTFSLILFIFAVLIFDSSAQTIDLKVKNVEIGTNYSEVLRKLGNPLSTQTGDEFPCNEGKVITLEYSGLTFKLIENSDNNNFFVTSANVTSNKFPVSGIKIGATVKAVKTKFGNTKLTKKSGVNTLNYFINNGYAHFYFIRGKLTKVNWEMNVC